MILRHLTLVMWIIINILDIATLMIVKTFRPVENETNILLLSGVPLWLIITLMLIITVVLTYYLGKLYTQNPYRILRYLIIYVIVLMIFLKAGGVMSNIRVLQIPADQIQPMPEEMKVQAYKDYTLNLQLLRQTAPRQTPFILILFCLNLLQFLVFRSFEEHRMVIISKKLQQ